MTAVAYVMVVDDDKALRESVCEVLEEDGYRAVSAESGASALRRLRAEPEKPDVILLDLMMPVMNGWQFREQQLSDPEIAEIPVVVMTASRDPQGIPADQIVHKPIKLQRLLDVVRRHAFHSAAAPGSSERAEDAALGDVDRPSLARSWRTPASGPAPDALRAACGAPIEPDEQRFKRLVSQVQAGIWETDLAGRFTFVNERYCELVGRTAAELQQMRVHDLIHPEDLPATVERRARLAADGTPFTLERRCVKPDGSIVWVQDSVVRIEDEAGEPQRVAGVTIDITRRKYAERALQEREEEVRRLLQSEQSARHEAETLYRVADDLGGARLDQDTLVQRITDRGTEMVGAAFGAFFYNVVDASGESYVLYTLSGAPKEAFSKLGLPRNTPIFAKTFRGEGVVRLDDVTADPSYGQLPPHFGMPKGHLPVVSYLAVPVISRTGQVIGGLFFGHPERARFSEQHERMIVAIAASAAVAMDNARLYQTTRMSEEQLRESEERYRHITEEANKALAFSDTFVGILGHDLRNPLTAIITASDLLLRRETNERVTRPIRRIRNSADRMTRMIEQILDFTRARIGGGIPIVPVTMDLGSLVVEIAEELEGAEPRQITVEQAGDLRGQWDRDRLAQAISNLLGNAVEHGAPSAPIQVSLDGTAADAVRMRLWNAGSIPESVLQGLFDPFRRASPEATGYRPKGLGLGLYVVQQIVRAHGGSIEVRSSPDEGTELTVILPRRSARTVRLYPRPGEN